MVYNISVHNERLEAIYTDIVDLFRGISYSWASIEDCYAKLFTSFKRDILFGCSRICFYIRMATNVWYNLCFAPRTNALDTKCRKR